MFKLLARIYDNRRTDSIATNLRKKRTGLFKYLISLMNSDLKILDVGGRQLFWENAGFFETKVEGKVQNVKITLFNLEEDNQILTHPDPNFQIIYGDAKNMKQFKDGEFDVVFSNSVIEHVGDYNDQFKMANEIRRVGKKYFIQTPNLYFPIEPHFVFPLFQFLPIWLKVALIRRFALGWVPQIPDKQEALKAATSIRLLTRKELIALFPTANILEEKFLGMTKSFIIYEGWEPSILNQYSIN